MERPLCPLCGIKHFAREAHVFRDNVLLGAKRKLVDAVPARKEGEVSQPPKPVDKKAEIGKKPVFDRKAYQREYVREWRKRRALKRKEVLGDGVGVVEVKSGGE